MLARHFWPVIKDDHKDAIKDYQRDQLSCNDAHNKAVQKSSSELDASVTETACRIRRQHCRRDVFDQAGCQQVERILCTQVARGRVEGQVQLSGSCPR